MNKEQSIGGYFELEINDLGSLYHNNAAALNTGRNALEHILNCKRYTHVYIPYFTCDVILEPFKNTDTPYTFYYVNEEFLPDISEISSNEALLYINYFGLMKGNICFLKEKFNNVIIDNSQAFYDMPFPNIPTFYSPRKFFGLPDGGFVYHACEISSKNYPRDVSFERCNHLIKSIELNKEMSYDEFKSNDASLINQPIKQMSFLTKKILKGIDFEKIKTVRIANFNYLHQHLRNTNLLTPFIEKANYACPMVYPYLANNNETLRMHLINNKVFTPKYWSNVINWVKINAFEFELTQNTIHLPIDQRYNEKELKSIIKLILK